MSGQQLITYISKSNAQESNATIQVEPNTYDGHLLDPVRHHQGTLFATRDIALDELICVELFDNPA